MSPSVRTGTIAYLAGQVPCDLDAGIAERTPWVPARIDVIVAALGAGESGIASVQVFADMTDSQGANAVLGESVGPGAPPALATGGVAPARPGMRVEMIAAAAAGQAA